MELTPPDANPGRYESVPGNTGTPWYRTKNLLVGVAVVLVIATVITLVVLLKPSDERSLPIKKFTELPPVQWIDDCPKSAPLCPSSFSGAPPPLLLVSLDGFRPDYLLRGLTPTLERLSRCGSAPLFMQPVFPTKTFPNHYSQVTGLYPSSHGIIDNFMVDPQTGKVFKLSSDTARESFWWEGEPIWVTAEKQGKKAATFFWPGSEVRIKDTRPSYYRNYSHELPFEERVDQVLRWLDLPPPERPSLLTLYMNEPDTAAHKHGIHAKQTNEALIKVDGLVERLFSGIQMRNLTNCINIFIMSDHGMADIDCSRSLNLAKLIDISSVETTDGALGRLRVADGANTTLEALTRDLQCRSDHMRVYRKEQLPVRVHYADHPRIEPLYLDMDSGWSLMKKEPQKKDYKCTGGMHGYDNLFPDMRATFMAVGPSIKRNYTSEPFVNIELYELMCDLIGVTPSPNNGTRGSLHHLLKKPQHPLQDEQEPEAPATAVSVLREEFSPKHAECSCDVFVEPKIDAGAARALHLPFGVPYSPDEETVCFCCTTPTTWRPTAPSGRWQPGLDSHLPLR
ncbi:hypothetical protein CDAR_391741 [Caerostris darwini]|uniref:Ectonucleotide pyrophosphatase/phosphodiesterase family member 3 n=1 Tax=Caerostris darwini TaxID=1538125 RepID=A0AAV4R1W4_9ARAC|nr:hypothetical protein CDAR_391741 [Caerostris darwini]